VNLFLKANYSIIYKQKLYFNRTLFHDFPLESEWALKSKQKYSKRRGGKCISKKVWKVLEEYFLERDINKSKRYTTATMLESLKGKVEKGELEDEEIPRLQTIQG